MLALKHRSHSLRVTPPLQRLAQAEAMAATALPRPLPGPEIWQGERFGPISQVLTRAGSFSSVRPPPSEASARWFRGRAARSSCGSRRAPPVQHEMEPRLTVIACRHLTASGQPNRRHSRQGPESCCRRIAMICSWLTFALASGRCRYTLVFPWKVDAAQAAPIGRSRLSEVAGG